MKKLLGGTEAAKERSRGVISKRRHLKGKMHRCSSRCEPHHSSCRSAFCYGKTRLPTSLLKPLTHLSTQATYPRTYSCHFPTNLLKPLSHLPNQATYLLTYSSHLLTYLLKPPNPLNHLPTHSI